MTDDAEPVTDGEAALVAAVRLMRLALPLLDRAGRDVAATLLQHALDEAEGAQVGVPTDEEVDRLLGA